MGCAPSKQHPPTSILVFPEEPVISENNFLQEEPDENDVDVPCEGIGLQDSMKSHISQISSISGQSSISWDSGVYELEDDYAHVITENSDPEKVREVDRQFVPKDDLELIVEGKACPRKLSSKDKERLQQQTILETLRKEGLIVRPPSRATGGLRFEVVSAQNPQHGSPLRRLPPITVRKKHKKRIKELTYEEIQEKLIKAEERRKLKSEEKLSKLASKTRHELQAIAEQQTEECRQKIEKNLQAKEQSRLQHLNEVQEKQKAREEYAKKVRERKQMLDSGFNYMVPFSDNDF